MSSRNTIEVVLGRHSQSGLNDDEVKLQSEMIIMHPHYDPRTIQNDIALVKLSAPVNFTDYIQPVCLAAAHSNFSTGTKSWVTGWGNTQSKLNAVVKMEHCTLLITHDS